MQDERRIIIAESRENLIKRFAYNAYQIRIRCGLEGNQNTDWQDGVKMYEDYCQLHDMLDRRKL